MNSNCNQNVAKKEVCGVQTNYSDRYLLLNSKKGKVTYKVTKQISDIFSTKRYEPIFKLLSIIENELTEPLPFTVELDYITLEGIKRCGDEEKGYINIKKFIGTRIFELINDLSIRKTTITAEKILDNYLGINDLKNLKEYYEKYHDIVMDCFSKNYTSLSIYDVIYRKKYSAKYLDNIYAAIKNTDTDKYSNLRREYACMLLVEYLSEMSIHASERTREEIAYQIGKINLGFNKLDVDTLASIPRDRRLIIDHVYNLL